MAENDPVAPLVAHGRMNLRTGGWFKDRDGMHPILSGSVNDDRLNEGKPTVIPFVYDGKRVSLDEAIERAISSGIQWPFAGSISEATKISKAASKAMDTYVGIKEPYNPFAEAPPETTPTGAPIVNPFAEALPDYSKLGEFGATKASLGQQAKIVAAYVTTSDVEARADILRNVLPGLTITSDPEGRPIASYKGETGYIDKPGVTLGGIADSVLQVFKYLPAAKAAALGGNLATRTLIAGGAAAATSAAEDLAAIPQGSEQGVNPEKAAITGAAAAVAQPVSELVIAPAVGWLARKGVAVWQAIRGTPQAVKADGTLTGIGRKLAEKAGLDPDQITPDLVRELESAATRATKAGVPDEQLPTAIERQALSQRFKVPLTKGEITDDYAQQSLEENLKRMDVTTRAGQTMRAAEKDAAGKLRGDTGESGFGLLRQQIAPKAGGDVSEAGQVVMERTRESASAAKRAYQGAYQSARESGAALDVRNFRDFLRNTEGALKESIDYDAMLFPKTAQQLEHLKGMESWFVGMGRESPRKLSLAKLENTRKVLNAAWKSADASDRLGLSVLKNQFDEMINGAVESGRIIGDPKAIQAFQAGRKLFSRYQELFAPNKEAGLAEQAAGRAVKNWLKSDAATGEDVIRQAVQNRALTKRIIDVNGLGSEAHTALKQGALEYIFRPALRNETVSPRLFVSQYERWFKGAGKEQMKAIFTEKDRAAIGEFVRLARAKIPQTGVVNTSNTANVFSKALQQLGQKLGIIGAATGHMETAAALGAVNAISNRVSGAQAKSAVRGLVPTTRLNVPVTAVAAGGAAQQD